MLALILARGEAIGRMNVLDEISKRRAARKETLKVEEQDKKQTDGYYVHFLDEGKETKLTPAEYQRWYNVKPYYQKLLITDPEFIQFEKDKDVLNSEGQANVGDLLVEISNKITKRKEQLWQKAVDQWTEKEKKELHDTEQFEELKQNDVDVKRYLELVKLTSVIMDRTLQLQYEKQLNEVTARLKDRGVYGLIVKETGLF